MTDKFKIKKSLHIEPKDLATITSPEEGDIAIDLNGDLNIYSSGSWGVATSVPNQNLSSGYQNTGDFSNNSYSRVIPQFPWTSPTKLTDLPSLTVPSFISGISWSPCGEFLAYGANASPWISLYQRSGTTFTKLANPAVLPPSSSNAISFSPNGEFLAVPHYVTPFITIYQRSGTTFTKLANPATLPASQTFEANWSPNGEFLVLTGLSASPWFLIYQRSGTTFTKIADPAILPPSFARASTWSPDGRFLAFIHANSPFITIYERSGTTFTKIADPSVSPGVTNQYAIKFSPDGRFLITVKNPGSPPYINNILRYKVSGNTFTAMPDLPDFSLPVDAIARGFSWSPSGKYLAVGMGTGSNSDPVGTIVYRVDGDVFTELPTPSYTPVGGVWGWDIAFSPNGEFLIRGITNSPYHVVYQTSSEMPEESVLTLPSIRRSGV